MTKEELALEVIRRLKEDYPDAGCTLDYDQAWKLLVSVRLAAQCTDARVNVVVEDLYAKYPDIKSLAEAPVDEIEAIVESSSDEQELLKELLRKAKINGGEDNVSAIIIKPLKEINNG